MIPYLGDFVEDDVVYLMFNTFSSDDPSASVTIANFLNTDVHIHKDDGLTQRNNAAGITVSVNFDGITGSHLIKIDTNDNTVAGFWVTGHDYFVRIEGTTIDGATINAVVGHFSIQNRYTRGTNSAALAATALLDTTWTDAKAVHLDANISSRNATTPPTVGEIRSEMEGAGTKLLAIETDTHDLQTNQGNWATATSVTVSDKTGFALSAAGVDAILDENIEGTHSVREMMRLFASMLVGKVSGGGTTTITFRDIDDTKNRIVMTVTDVGNRTGVVLTES